MVPGAGVKPPEGGALLPRVAKTEGDEFGPDRFSGAAHLILAQRSLANCRPGPRIGLRARHQPIR